MKISQTNEDWATVSCFYMILYLMMFLRSLMQMSFLFLFLQPLSCRFLSAETLFFMLDLVKLVNKDFVLLQQN